MVSIFLLKAFSLHPVHPRSLSHRLLGIWILSMWYSSFNAYLSWLGGLIYLHMWLQIKPAFQLLLESGGRFSKQFCFKIISCWSFQLNCMLTRWQGEEINFFKIYIDQLRCKELSCLSIKQCELLHLQKLWHTLPSKVAKFVTAVCMTEEFSGPSNQCLLLGSIDNIMNRGLQWLRGRWNTR